MLNKNYETSVKKP